jgi:hypothetical protein
VIIEKSFGLIRTNPALTTNVKIVITGEYNIYLESFLVNSGLNDNRYKHFEVKVTDYLYESLYYFYLNGVPLEQAYEGPTLNDADHMYNDYQNQYDDTYLAGATWTEDTWYTEEFEYFAPLYVNIAKRPKYFAILRVDGPGLKISNSASFRPDIVEQWKFVTMFDLTNATPLGRWLDQNLDDPNFPTAPLTVRFDDYTYTDLSGINIETGGWVTKTIDFSEEQHVNTPIFKTEELITSSFQSNNVVYPNILNLKFLFDDTPAAPDSLRQYSINRYLGFYLDDLELVKNATPHQPFDLNKVADNLIETLSVIDCSEIPYLQNNLFVRDILGRTYSFDPIKNGWDDSKIYWIEYQENFYRLDKVPNTNQNIIGDFNYKVIANITLQRTIDADIQNLINTGATINPEILTQQQKVIINDLSTMKSRVEIVPRVVFPNFQANNVISNVNPNFITYQRNFTTIVEGEPYLFTLSLSNDINNNLFSIDNFDAADLYIVDVSGVYYILKQYPQNTPNVGGSYYLQSDWAVSADSISLQTWINNGILTKDPNFYTSVDVQKIVAGSEPVTLKIYRVKFSDIKDFDFDRVETRYSDFEYEINDNFTDTIEPKFYAKEHRVLNVQVNRFPKEYIQRQPILDLNNEIYDPNEFQLDFNGNIIYTDDTKYQTLQITLPREYYREENYLYLVDGDPTKVIDFTLNSDPVVYNEQAVFGTAGYTIDEIKLLPIVNIWPDESTWTDIVGRKLILNSNGKTLPNINAKRDPNQNYDANYVPVSSEYIASDELFEVRGLNLSPIWSKNPSICKWGFLNSNNSGDYSYRLNYDLIVGGLDNRSPNIYSNLQYPLRFARDLDFFYRFGLVNNTNYKNYSLHLKDSYFDIDKYFSTSFDYFEGLFKSDQLTSDGIKLNQKYSVFHSGSDIVNPYTLFKGIKYNISDVNTIQSEVFLNTTTNTNQTYIEDIFTTASTKYNGYRFVIVMGRKLSIFNNNPGRNNGNFGIDIYLNDIWKNIVINLYFETDETLQIDDPAVTTTRFINAETCIIDKWYQDQDVARTDLNGLIWDKLEFKINGQNIGVRPRDLRLIEFMTIINNLNYRPDLTVQGDTRNPVSFIHIYSDGTNKVMSNENTDFFIRTELPTEYLVKENGYVTTPVVVPLDINNSLINTIVLADNKNDPTKTLDGVLVGIVPDLNAYNGYPFAFTITDDNTDTRPIYDLQEGVDPDIHRYGGPYVPIFRNVDLFRPLNYIGINYTNPLSTGNYKFYDPRNSGTLSTTTIQTFGFISELIFSKVNLAGSILKLNDPSSNYHSVFPMVDECGYSYIPKYIFQSNWDIEFYLESKKRILTQNQYPTQSGYSVYFSGNNDKIIIPDMDKFNYYIDGFQDGNIQVFDQNTLYSGWQPGSSADLTNVAFDQDASDGLARRGTEDNRTLSDFIYGPYTDLSPGTYTITYRIKIELDPTISLDETQTLFTLDVSENYGGHIITTEIITGAEVPEYGTYNDYTLTFDNLTFLNRAEFRIAVNYPPAPLGKNGNVIYCDYITSQREEIIIPVQFYQNPSVSGINIPIANLLVPAMYYRFYYTGTSMTITGTNVYQYNTLATLIGSSSRTDSTSTFATSLVYLPISYYPSLLLGGFVKYIGSGTITQLQIEEATPYVDINFNDFSVGQGFCLQMKKDTDDSYAKIEIDNITSVNDLVTRLRVILTNTSLPGQTSVTNRASLFSTQGNSIYNVTAVDTSLDNAKIKIHLIDQINPITDYNFKILPKKTNTSQIDYDYVYKDYQVVPNFFNSRIKIRGFFSKPLSFIITPVNFSAINILVNTINTTNNNPLLVNDIIKQINNQLSGKPFIASLTTSTTDYFEFYITSNSNGSYYNFTIAANNVKSYVKTVKMIGRPATILVHRILKPVRNGHFANIRFDYLRPIRNGILKPVIIKPKQVVLFSQPVLIPRVGFLSSSKIDALIAQQTAAVTAQQAAINALNFNTPSNIVSVQEKSVATIAIEMDTTLINEVVGGKHINLQKSKVGYTNSFTIEFWVLVNGWINTSETIMYKGLDGVDSWTESTLYNSPNFSWVIGRDSNNDRLSFRTCQIKPALLKSLTTYKPYQHYFLGQIILFNNVFYDVVVINIQPTSSFSAIPSSSIKQKLYTDVVDVHTLTSTKDISDQNWHHVAFTLDGDLNQKTIYIDGTIDTQYKNDDPLLTNIRTSMTGSVDNIDLDNWNILIGTDSIVNNGLRNFLGSIDEIRIWNYSRSADNIYNNFRLLLTKSSYLDPQKSLIFYLRLDEGKGVNTFSDIMTWDPDVQRGWLVNNIDRYQITSKLTQNDGKNENITNDISVRQFVNSWDLPDGTTSIPSSRQILINDTNIEWVLSGADIQGLSDERYTSPIPPASTTQQIISLAKVIVPKSKFVVKQAPTPIPSPIPTVSPDVIQTFAVFTKHLQFSIQKPNTVAPTITAQPQVDDNPFRIFGLVNVNKPIQSWYTKKTQEVTMINTRTLAGIQQVFQSIYNPYKN